MNKPGNGRIKTSPVRQPVLLGLFTGTAVGVGYLLAGVPNVELMTLVIALAGAALGLRAGFLVGVLAAVIFSLGSPYGLPHPLLLLAQTLGMGLAGMVGRWGSGPLIRNLADRRRIRSLILAGGTGFAATLSYDLLTNLAIVRAFDLAPAVVFAGAVPFFLIHAGVNTAVFAILLPVLLPRLAHLGRAPLAGRSVGPSDLFVVILLMYLTAGNASAQELESPAMAAAPPDSVAEISRVDVPDSLTTPVEGSPPPVSDISRRASEAKGWRRSLWTPFAPTALTWLNWYSPWVPVSDGGLGAPSVVLGEAGTSSVPMFTRDGIPVGTGHVLADDPVLVPTEGLVLRDKGMGADGWGGSGGLIQLDTEDPDPGKAVSAYRGVKGNHETYFRAIHVLTPEAAWRAAFEFEESLDREGYNFTEDPDEIFQETRSDGFPGHASVRQSRTRLFRRLDSENRLVVEYSNGRKTKDSLPALGADQQEIWDDGIAATMTARTGSVRWRTSLFWKNRDIEWGDRDTVGVDNNRRKVETGREGLSLELTPAPLSGRHDPPPLSGLSLLFTRWSVYDTGTPDNWAADFTGSGNGEGNNALVSARTGFRSGATRLMLGLGGQWDRHAGFGPELDLAWGADDLDPWWRVDLYYGGRAPRSDELLTPLLHVVDTRRLALLPNPDLKREKTLRAGLLFKRRLLGIDLAVDGSVRHLTEGITWESLVPDGDIGVWTNGLEMDAAKVTGSLGREGRFLGWGRVKLEGTWQSFDEKIGRASLLPPDKYLRLHVMWENHFFKEDGILQLALFSTRQAEMADPWDVTRNTLLLPARTVHDLLVGFRLVGANLSLAFRNLTGEKTRMTAGALSHEQELDLRLHWTFRY
jgi:energy-coupling factor transport system substrate-specific component